MYNSKNEPLAFLSLISLLFIFQIDLTLLPFAAKGPLHTPPIENYECPDGDYTDVSRNFEKEYRDRKAALEEILNKNKKPHQRKK